MFVKIKSTFSLSVECVFSACLMFMNFEIDMAMINSYGYICRFVILFDHVCMIGNSIMFDGPSNDWMLLACTSKSIFFSSASFIALDVFSSIVNDLDFILDYWQFNQIFLNVHAFLLLLSSSP